MKCPLPLLVVYFRTGSAFLRAAPNGTPDTFSARARARSSEIVGSAAIILSAFEIEDKKLAAPSSSQMVPNVSRANLSETHRFGLTGKADVRFSLVKRGPLEIQDKRREKRSKGRRA